jgi:hypothetical protein
MQGFSFCAGLSHEETDFGGFGQLSALKRSTSRAQFKDAAGDRLEEQTHINAPDRQTSAVTPPSVWLHQPQSGTHYRFL